MSIRNLDAIFKPAAVAIIGATPRPGSAGALVLHNLKAAGFDGPILLVNPRHRTIDGLPVYAAIDQLPQPPDLAILATPPETVPGLIAELGAKGARGAVVIAAGFGTTDAASATRRQALLDAAKPYLLRVIGPDSVGVAVPDQHLNAGLGHLAPAPGGLAFITQSGALASALLDWARPRGIGFSHVVSLGEMADVDFGDMLDYLGDDGRTRAILLYVEHLSAARKFMSAARAAARRKPVLVVKVGRFAAEGTPAASTIEALATPDRVHDAAFRRAGMLRVRDMADLFAAAETLATTGSQSGERLAIIANGGGPGALAADALLERGGRLARFGADTVARLGQVLPFHGSGGNPIDLGGEADAARYRAVLEILLKDRDVDAVLAINCPTALNPPDAAARAVIETATAARLGQGGRNLLTAWLGDHEARAARALFAAASIASYDTPDEAIAGFMDRVDYHRNQELLLETVPSRPAGLAIASADADAIVTAALERGPGWLSPDETGRLLAAYGIPCAPRHKPRAGAIDLIAGMAQDPLFGPVILFGHGGDGAALLQDVTAEFPPLNLTLARAQMARTRIHRLLRDSAGRPAAAIDAVADILIRLGQLVTDRAEIAAIEINPLIVDDAGATAETARIRIAPASLPGTERLAIRPYPVEYESDARLGDGTVLKLRPIRPEDEPGIVALANGMTPEDRRMRFFVPLKELTHQFAAKLTQIDYEREMALVAVAPSGEIWGVARFFADPDNVRAEFAIAVRSNVKGRGLGYLLMSRLIAVAVARGIDELFGTVLSENEAMLSLCRGLGFGLAHHPREPGIVIATKPLRH